MLPELGAVDSKGLRVAAGAAGMSFSEDGECDGGGRIATEIETGGGMQAFGTLFHTEAQCGGGLTDEQAGAMARAEQSEITRRDRQELGEESEILRVAVSHEDDSVGGLEVECGEVVVFGENDDGVRVGKAFGAGELGAAIGDDDVPAERGGEVDEGLGVVARTEDDEALRGKQRLHEDRRCGAAEPDEGLNCCGRE